MGVWTTIDRVVMAMEMVVKLMEAMETMAVMIVSPMELWCHRKRGGERSPYSCCYSSLASP
jgi:hypothetical protein